MDFEQRLERAIERGRRQSQNEAQTAAQQAMNEEQARRLHTKYRLELCDYIERCLKRLPDYFPGFRFESIASDGSWGAAVSRDDVHRSEGGRANAFSRLEVTIRPYHPYQVIEIAAKGTIRNKEVFSRNQFQRLAQVDTHTFMEVIDQWTIEYAELYAAKT